MAQFAEIISLIGVAMVVTAYFFVSSGRWSAQSLRYHLFNLTGSLGILFSVFFYWNLSTLAIQCIWISISLYGIVRALRQRRRAD